MIYFFKKYVQIIPFADADCCTSCGHVIKHNKGLSSSELLDGHIFGKSQIIILIKM